jgi:hypothetical protein
MVMTYGPPDLEWHMPSVGPIYQNEAELRGIFAGTNASAAWPAANVALYIPIYVRKVVTVYALFWVNGSTVAGNACLGLYNEAGQRIAQTGVVAQATASVPQQPSITAFQLAPGRYWAGLASTSITATFRAWNAGVTTDATKWLGVGEEAVTAGQVPASMTPVASARNYLPLVGLRVISQAF